MAKIVVLATGADADAVKTALGDAGVDFEIVKPTAANLLHIAIGMVDDGDEPDEPPADEPPADEPPAEEPPADEPPADEPPVEEALGQVTLMGELVEAVAVPGLEKSMLSVERFSEDPHKMFSLNEMTVTLWANDFLAYLEVGNVGKSVSLEICEGKQRLLIGADLIHLFKTK